MLCSPGMGIDNWALVVSQRQLAKRALHEVFEPRAFTAMWLAQL